MSNINDDIRENLKIVRNLREKNKALNSTNGITLNENVDDEEIEKNNDAVPYTGQDEIYVKSVQPAMNNLQASFDGIKNPILYYPKDGDITLSGKLPILGKNVKFQFRLLSSPGSGCFLWCDYLVLNEQTMINLKRVSAFYENWCNDIRANTDKKPMNYKDVNNNNLNPGDDSEMNSNSNGK